MAELTRGQKAAQTRARNKAKREAEAAEQAAVEETEVIGYVDVESDGVPFADLAWFESQATAMVELADNVNLAFADLTFARDINGVLVTMTLVQGVWMVKFDG